MSHDELMIVFESLRLSIVLLNGFRFCFGPGLIRGRLPIFRWSGPDMSGSPAIRSNNVYDCAALYKRLGSNAGWRT